MRVLTRWFGFCPHDSGVSSSRLSGCSDVRFVVQQLMDVFLFVCTLFAPHSLLSRTIRFANGSAPCGNEETRALYRSIALL